ncbi:MAG: twin-arginine translocation signal domain-containing protein [Candidatus Eisenbacteria bacterium]|nr:twin-arginine translocation signal domain-containing protein [Candidatus Eisenbacteria bacterium]
MRLPMRCARATRCRCRGWGASGWHAERRRGGIPPHRWGLGRSGVMNSRRRFLKQSAAALAWAGGGSLLAGLTDLDWPGGIRRAWAGDETVITILHTNDVHSRIDPFPEGKGRNAGLGGASRRATLVRRIRAQSPHTLLVDGGDVFQGTPYFNLYHGEVDFRVMSALGYTAMTIGNHEFDAGLDGLAAAAEHADFDLLSANYDFRGTRLADRVRPYTLREVGGYRVGLFGLGVALEGLVAAPLCRGVTYSDPVAAARRMTELLRTEKRCDLVVCLSHLGNRGYAGHPGEQDVARQVSGIDLIVGGHSHTFMDEPTRVRHGSRETLVFQVGWAGINLGRVDFHMQRGEVREARAAAIPLRLREDEGAAA